MTTSEFRHTCIRLRLGSKQKEYEGQINVDMFDDIGELVSEMLQLPSCSVPWWDQLKIKILIMDFAK